MRLLIMLLLCTSYSFAEKVKEINSIKVPKGIVAQYDELENIYNISYKTFIDPMFGIYNPLSLRMKKNSTETFIIVDTEFQASSWLFVESVTIYIINEDIQKFEYTWDSRNTSIIFEHNTENNATINNELSQFLLDNIKLDSEIKVRFYGKSSYITRKISKKSIKSMYTLLEFYKLLSENPL